MNRQVNQNQMRSMKHLGWKLAAVLICLPSLLLAQSSREDVDIFEERYSYSDNPRVGERLSVRFPNAPSELVQSTELVVFEEGYYDADNRKFSRRSVALITGMGMGSSGLKLVISDTDQRNQLENVLERFTRVNERFLDYQETIHEKNEEWMADPRELVGSSRIIGEAFFYPSRKPLDVEFNWDFELNRVWMTMGSRVFIEREAVPFIRHLVANLGRYENVLYDFRNNVDSKNTEIDNLLGL